MSLNEADSSWMDVDERTSISGFEPTYVLPVGPGGVSSLRTLLGKPGTGESWRLVREPQETIVSSTYNR